MAFIDLDYNTLNSKFFNPRIFKVLSLLVLFVVSIGTSLSAQDKTIVKGKVFDARTNEPLAFVDVIFKGTFVGASTDLDGQYLLNTKIPSDTLSASYLSLIHI